MTDNTKDDGITRNGPIRHGRLTTIWETARDPQAQHDDLAAKSVVPQQFRNLGPGGQALNNWWPDGPQRCYDEHGNSETRWYLDGRIHRDGGPAIEKDWGMKLWYRDGRLHRDDGPAIEYPNGDREWCRDGQLHRDDGPAIERKDGTKLWCRDGQLHRDDGPAIEYPNGDREWWRNDQLHRDNGPAIELTVQVWAHIPDYFQPHREWWRNGRLHRDDGPAIEYPSGRRSWYLDGQEVSRESFNRIRGAHAWTRQLY